MDKKLAQITTVPQKDKGPAYQALLTELFADPSSPHIAQGVHAFIEHLVTQDPGIIVGRQILAELVRNLSSLPAGDPDIRKSIIEDVLATVQPRLTTYEEQVSINASIPHSY